MGHPWTRPCKNPGCDRKFTSNSNGRLYCYTCTPSRTLGAAKKFGAKVGDGQISPEKQQLRKDQVSDIDELIDVVVSQADDIEARARVVPAHFQLGDNSSGDRVVMKGRPAGGWGRCSYTDPLSVLQVCTKERFYESSPFCDGHIRIFRDLRGKRMAQKLASADERVRRIPLSDFKITSPSVAIKLLAKVAHFVEQGWMTTVKAACIIQVVDAQMKALRADRDERKTGAEITFLLARINKMKQGMNPEKKDPDFSAEEEAELRGIAKRHDIGKDGHKDE